jgi:hypothetical protein
MAGGLFGRPFVFNIKCIIFSLLMMALFLVKPTIKSNLILGVTLFIIFVISYVAMAWYDYRYNCDLIMYSGNSLGPNTIDAIFKPQHRNKKSDKKNLSKNQEIEYLKRVYLFHILAVSPILLYVGYYGLESNKKIFPVVLALGGISTVYHGFRSFYPRNTSN